MTARHVLAAGDVETLVARHGQLMLLMELGAPGEILAVSAGGWMFLLLDAALVLRKDRRSLRDLVARTDVIDV